MYSDDGWNNILYWIMRLHVDNHVDIEDERTRLAMCELLDAQKVEHEEYNNMIILK